MTDKPATIPCRNASPDDRIQEMTLAGLRRYAGARQEDSGNIRDFVTESDMQDMRYRDKSRHVRYSIS